MYPNISAFDKSNEKESLNNIQSNKRFSIVSIRLAVPGFKQEHLTIHENQVVVHLSSTRKTSACPYCGRRTKHVHSYYFRHIQGSESFNMSTVLLVKARRFRCKHCVRTFSESLPGISSPLWTKNPRSFRQNYFCIFKNDFSYRFILIGASAYLL